MGAPPTSLQEWLDAPAGARVAVQRQSADGGLEWILGAVPQEIIRAGALADVIPALEILEQLTAKGAIAIGGVAYEAASACDPRLVTHTPSKNWPLLWFAIFEEVLTLPDLTLLLGDIPDLQWTPSITREEYLAAVHRIREFIAAGDTYQVNFTFQQSAALEDADPLQLFAALLAQQPTRHAAYIEMGERAICSASPEQFFALEGDSIRTRPMKGTSQRGRWLQEDEARMQALHDSEKNRAENVMIVDMLRNDLGRIAKTGSVQVPQLFTGERYPTLLQMTSTVTAQTDASLVDLFCALFPCASVTGAPKVRTMQIIRELEAGPRGFYCGALGSVGPGRRADFNVGIRTLLVDRRAGQLSYGIGSGIVWGSDPEREYDECLLKAAVLKPTEPEFTLYETLRWSPETGIGMLERHLQRLADSATYFGFRCERTAIESELEQVTAALSGGPHRLRLELARDGALQVQAVPLDPTEIEPAVIWKLAIAADRVDSQDRLLFHKTSQRARNHSARAAHPAADEVLFVNERGELTEGSFTNVAIRRDGQWITPTLDCGLLPGTLRAHLLDEGTIVEGIVRLDELTLETEFALFNAVRGWIRGQLTELPSLEN